MTSLVKRLVGVADAPRSHLRRGSIIGSVARRSPLRFAALASAVVGLTLGTAPARALDEPLIQPGAPVRLSGGPPGPGCTLSFVFRDADHTYIGSVARCATTIGERASMAGRQFGTVVFRVAAMDGVTDPSAVDTTTRPLDPIDDLALIRVDASELHRVSPVVLDVGRAPQGVTTADQTTEGDQMSMTGQGAGYREGPTRHRRGVLISDDNRQFHLAIPASLGDGGAPVLDANFNAYGVLSSNFSVMGPYGMTIERILKLLHEAGFDVELVTA